MAAERGPARPVRGSRPEGSKRGGDDGGILADPPLVYDRRGLAHALGVSVRHLDGLRSRGALPAPVRLGAAVRWDAGEIARWVAAGCPPRERWDAMRGARGGRP